MKITLDNLYKIPEKERHIVRNLKCDVDEINYKDKSKAPIYIDWQDYHDEYSPERTDPCPDYYGYYTIKRNGDNLGIEMTLDDLDMSLCLLYSYVCDAQ